MSIPCRTLHGLSSQHLVCLYIHHNHQQPCQWLGNLTSSQTTYNHLCRYKSPCLLALSHLVTRLQALHAAGLVHRDVKPMNIIFAEDEKRFKLIDLGACADLRSGTNYIPDESILDPTYCPPEQVRYPVSVVVVCDSCPLLALVLFNTIHFLILKTTLNFCLWFPINHIS